MAGAAASGLVAPGLAGRAAAAVAPLDITFFQVGDPHYQAFDTTSDYNVLTRESLRKLAGLAPSSPFPGAGTLGVPQILINVGDIVDSGAEVDPATGLRLAKTPMLEQQWSNYVTDFGLLGTEAGTLVKLPVYEGYGNHDQDGFLKQVSDRIGQRASLLPNITAQSGVYTYQGAWGNISVTGVHYAWKMGPIHFVQTNLRVGDGPERYPCSGSYSFLKNYLEGVVGTSGAPVFVVVHLPPTTDLEDEWPRADRQKFYDLIRRFNTVGIINGHTHSYAHYLWRGPDNTGPVGIPVYQCDSLHNSGATRGIFNAFRIIGSPTDPNKATVYMAQRLRNDTWGNRVTREISLIYNPPSTDPPPGPDPNALNVVQWQSLNLHNGLACGLGIPANGFVEPRRAGLRHIEVLFDRPITLANPAAAVSVSGVTASGPASLSSLGISLTNSIGPSGKSLDIRFSAPLPDASKWRITLNPAAIAGSDGTQLATTATGTAAATRALGVLLGDCDGDGLVTGTDLNLIANTTAFDPAIVNCVRADLSGDALINAVDLSAAWNNRNNRIDTLSLP